MEEFFFALQKNQISSLINMTYLQLGAEHQNLTLYYEVHGQGHNKILFIMGLLADGAAWIHQTEYFRQKSDYQVDRFVRCVSYDNRGCNRSSSPLTLNYTTIQMGKDALALIDHLQWSRCHVVGISMGGMIALELALLAPSRILSLTLLATHAGGFAGRTPMSGVKHILRSMTIRDHDRLVENAMALLYADKTLINVDKRKNLFSFHSQRFQNRIRPTLIGIFGQFTAVLRHYVSYAHLLKIRYSSFPCLIIVGSEDQLVREKNSYLLQRALGCRLIKLDDAGHGLHGEYADEINEELYHLFESIRKKKLEEKNEKNSDDYQMEMNAVEKCCQHRTDCFIHDLFGYVQGLVIGFILFYFIFTLIGWKISFRAVNFIGCFNGIRRAFSCLFHAFRARRFVVQHQLELKRAADHGGFGVSFDDQGQNGIPHDCGFDYPYRSLIVIFLLVVFVVLT